jgi:integrase/recombinase XerD
MNIHTAENYEAAQQIIKALALPTASGAPVASRPLPLSHLPRLPSETSMGVRHRACRSFWEGHEPRNHRCLAVGVRPAELVAAPAMVEFRLIADYIPPVEKAVTKVTRRVYGPYWARVVREWGYSRVNEPTALEISQLAEQVRAGAVQRRNTGGGRGAAEHLIGALLARRYPETQTISLVLDDTIICSSRGGVVHVRHGADGCRGDRCGRAYLLLVQHVDQAGGAMHVQRVAMPGSRVESWTVLGDDDVPVEPVERYLAYLTAIGRSPNTVKAYAHDLKDYWVFLRGRGLDWRQVRLEDIGEYVAWLRLPAPGRAGQVAVLPSAGPAVAASTVSRKLSALAAFYQHQARNGVDVGELLTCWQVPGRRGGWKPFLHHISKNMPQPARAITVKVPKKLPRILTAAEMQAIVDACDHLRDRFLLALLWDSGIRVGEALGLRHEDICPAGREITIVPRANDNGARSKSRDARTVPVSTQVIRLWGDYLHEEYGDLDSDYVFVNLFAAPRGRALGYPAVYDLIRRLRDRTGIDFDPHWCRHSAATRMLRDGVPVEVVSKLLGHASVTTTLSVYGHLTAEDARRALQKAGWFTGGEVTW